MQGKAPYAYEVHDGPKPAYGYLLTAGSGKAKINFLDTEKAEAAAGVLLVMTYRNASAQGDPSPETVPQLRGPEIMHNGEAIALKPLNTSGLTLLSPDNAENSCPLVGSAVSRTLLTVVTAQQ